MRTATILKIGIGLLFTLLFIGVGYAWIPAPELAREMGDLQNQKIPVGASLLLHFTQPMNKASVEKGVTMTPALPGQWVWQNRRVVEYHPSEPLKTGDKVELHLTASIRSVWGKPLKGEHVLVFTVTGPPVALFVNPLGSSDSPSIVSLHQPITVLFDRPMAEEVPNPSLFNLDPPATGSLQWITPEAFQFIPDELKGNTLYSLTIPAGIPALGGGKTEAEFRVQFRTPGLHLTSTIPAEGEKEVELQVPLRLTFNQEMDLNLLQPGRNVLLFPSNDAGATLHPKEDGFFNTEARYATDEKGAIDKHTLVFTPTFSYLPGQEYRLVFKAGLDAPFTLTFTTKNPPTPEETVSSGPTNAPIYFVTDHSWYQSGDTLHFYGIDQEAGKDGWTLELKDENKNPALTLHPAFAGGLSGAFFGETVLPDDLNPGRYTLLDQPIRIETPENPRWQINPVNMAASYPAGTPVVLNFQTMNARGFVASGRKGTYRFTRVSDPATFSVDERLYTMGTPPADSHPDTSVAAGSVQADPEGHLALAFDPQKTALEPGYAYTLTLRLPNGADDSTLSQTHFTITPGDYAVGLSAEHQWIQAGQNLEFYFMAAAHGSLLSGKKVKFTFGSLWNETLATGSEPKRITVPVPASANGNYVLTAESEDGQGRSIRSSIPVTVVGHESPRPSSLVVIPDQIQYLVGEKAHLKIRGADPNLKTLPVTIEWAGKKETRTLDLKASNATLDIAIEDSMAPRVLVTVADAKAELRVSLREKTIKIDLQSSVLPAVEGQRSVSVRLKTYDYQERPVPSQITLWVVEGDGPSVTGKWDYFNALLKTDAAGLGEVTIPLPDDFHRGRIVARAMQGEGRFGSGEIPLTLEKPLEIIPDLPAFVNPGDQFPLRVKVQNNTDRLLQSSLELIADSLEKAGRPAYRQAGQKSLTIPARASIELSWDVHVLPTDKSELSVAFRTPETFLTKTLPLGTKEELKTLETVTKGADLSPFKTPSGGYAFWPHGREANPFFTAYALAVQGQASPEPVRYLLKTLHEAESSLSPVEQAMILWALSEMGQYDTSSTLALYATRSNLPEWAKPLLLMNLYNLIQGGQKSVGPFVEQLKSELASETTGAPDPLLFFALNRVSPGNPLLENPPQVLSPQNPLWLQTFQPDAPSPASNGLILTRKYEPLGGSPGVYRGTLTMIVPHDLSSVLVREFFPAGFTPLSLAPELTDPLVQKDRLEEARRNGYTVDPNPLWEFDHAELSPSGLVLGADHLSAGVYTIPFLLKTAHPGVYEHPPAYAQSLLDPAVFARTARENVEITP